MKRWFTHIYGLQRSIKRLLPEQISWLSEGFTSSLRWHSDILLASAAGWHGSGAFQSCYLTVFWNVASLRSKVCFFCFLQIKLVLNCASFRPWTCPGVACGMRTSTFVSEGTALQLKRELLLMSDGKVTRAFCWSINCKAGGVKWELSRKEELSSSAHTHFNYEKNSWN